MEWTCNADAGCLAWIRDSIRKELSSRLDAKQLDEVVLGVGEACANIVKHAYEGKGGPLTVRLEKGAEDFEIELRNRGKPLDPGACRPRSLDDIRPGGLGTYFMSCVFDEIRYEREPDGTNVVVMRRKWTRPDPKDGDR